MSQSESRQQTCLHPEWETVIVLPVGGDWIRCKKCGKLQDVTEDADGY